MDKMYYGYAAAEVMEGIIDPALMVKAMSLSKGDERTGRAIYIELRAEELEAECRKEKVARIVNSTTSAAAFAVENLKNTTFLSKETKKEAKKGLIRVLWFFIGIIFLIIVIIIIDLLN